MRPATESTGSVNMKRSEVKATTWPARAPAESEVHQPGMS